MKELGEIVKLEGKQAVIRIQRSSACKQCGACQLGCHRDEMLLTIPNRLGGKPGDMVELSLDSVQVLKASAIIYLIPLLALIAGVALGYLFSRRISINSQLAGALGGLIFTTAAFIIIRTIDPLLRKNNNFTPRMVALLNGDRKEN
jgi:sigma-E factor negative regulatory protein RseC